MATKTHGLEQLSPFQLKDQLIQYAREAARGSPRRTSS
jgi:hypothetical protein